MPWTCFICSTTSHFTAPATPVIILCLMASQPPGASNRWRTSDQLMHIKYSKSHLSFSGRPWNWDNFILHFFSYLITLYHWALVCCNDHLFFLQLYAVLKAYYRTGKPRNVYGNFTVTFKLFNTHTDLITFQDANIAMLPFTMPERNTQQNSFLHVSRDLEFSMESILPTIPFDFSLGLLKIILSYGEMWGGCQNFP